MGWLLLIPDPMVHERCPNLRRVLHEFFPSARRFIATRLCIRSLRRPSARPAKGHKPFFLSNYAIPLTLAEYYIKPNNSK